MSWYLHYEGRLRQPLFVNLKPKFWHFIEEMDLGISSFQRRDKAARKARAIWERAIRTWDAMTDGHGELVNPTLVWKEGLSAKE